MKILITGICGFIGSHLAEYLIKQGHKVSGIDNLSGGSFLASGDILIGDCRNRWQLDQAAKGCEYVYHAASTVGVTKVLENPSACISNIIDSTRSVLGLGLPGMFFSTSEVYGKRDPVASYIPGTTIRQSKDYQSPFSETDDIRISSAPRWTYAAAKFLGEHLAAGAGWPSVRLFNVAGPRQNPAYGAVLPRFIEQHAKSEPMTVYGDGTQVRTFTSVHDVVRILNLLRGKHFGVVNVGSTNTVSIERLAVKITMDGSGGVRTYVPYESAYPAGFEECPSRVPDLTKLHSIIGVQQYIPLESIIQEMKEHYAQSQRKERQFGHAPDEQECRSAV